MKNMKTENVLKLILKMGMPMVISMMVNSLYNIVDSLFVAKMSENAMTALSLVYAVIMVVIQFIQFVTALRQSGKRLLSVCVIYFPVMFSLFILSMYAVIGVVLLFIIKFALSVMEENSRK